MKIGLELPINTTSLGNISTSFLRNLFERQKLQEKEDDIYLFPIGNPDLGNQKPDAEFEKWLQGKINRAVESYSRDIPLFKLWHLNGSLQSFSRNQTLLTFFELNKPTKVELNIAKNNKTCLSSKFSQAAFRTFGVETEYLPLFFDKYNFSKLDKKFHGDDRIVFNLCGKFEKRKHHDKIIKAWIKKYGENRNYVLQCALYNPFLVQQTPQGVVDHNNKFFAEAVKGNKPYNVTFFPMMRENMVYNEFLNSSNIIIGMSGGESWDLPVMHSVALGKHAVIMNAHAYKDWATPENSVLVNPSGSEEVYDNIFFQKGTPWNQGDIFSFDDDAFIDGCEQAIQRVKNNPVNSAGLELQQKFTVDMFSDKVISLLQ